MFELIPIYPHVDEAQRITEEHRHKGCKAAQSAPCGTFNSSTVIVMMMALTHR